MLQIIAYCTLAIALFTTQTSFALTTFEQGCLEGHQECEHLRSDPPINFASGAKLQQFMDSPGERAKYECVKNSKYEHQDFAHAMACIQAIRHYQFHQACQQEVLAHCAKVVPGDGKISECLSAKGTLPKLGAACRALVQQHLQGPLLCNHRPCGPLRSDDVDC